MPANPTLANEIPSTGLTLITTRLVPPRLAENCLVRKRLLKRCSWLESNVGGHLFLVTAPAGYGKSTLLAQIFRRVQDMNQSAVWLTLDKDDNDEEQFGSYLEELLNQLTGEESGDMARPANSHYAINNFISRLAASEGQYAVFLDDYHVITNSRIHESLHYLIKYLPENLDIFIGSRQPMPIPLARFKAAGKLIHIDTDDLSFDLDETRALLCETNKIDISEPELELLHQRTGGWAVILQLTALSLHTTGNRAKLVDALSAGQDIAADFLSEELVAQLPLSQVNFLRQIAIVDQFCPALCMAITGDKELSGSLVKLQESGLPIQRLDHTNHWFCLHPLFRNYLLRQLDGDMGVDQRELHRRAGLWFQDEDLLGEAIQHAISAGNEQHALELLDDQGVTLLTQGYLLQFLSLIRRLPEDLFHSSQNLLIQLAWVQVLSYQLPDAKKIIAELNHHIDVMDPVRRAEVHAIECNLYCIEDKLEEAAGLIDKWLPEVPENPPYIRTSFLVLQAIIAFNQKDFPRVMALSRVALDQDTSSDTIAPQAYAVCTSALVYIATIQLKTGTETLSKQYQRLRGHVGSHSLLVALIEPLLGILLYYQGDLASAERHFHHGTKALSICASVDLVILVVRTRSRLLDSQGRINEAIVFLNEAQELAEERGWLRLQACVMHERVRLFLALGELLKAQNCMSQWLEHERSQEPTPLHAISSVDEWTQVAKVRLMLAEGKGEEAAGELKTMIHEFLDHGRTLRAMEAWVLLAKSHMVSGKLREAKEALSEALVLDHENSVIQLFRDEGDEVIAALVALDKDFKCAREPQQHTLWQKQIAAVVEPFGVEVVEETKTFQLPADIEIAEKLTRKELATLALLVEGHSNKEISERLFVSTNTVKTHLQRAYGKLGVSSRTQAVRSLRELGIFV